MKRILLILILGCFALGTFAQSKKEKREEDSKRGYMLLDTHEQPKNKKLTSQKYQSSKSKNQKKREKEAKKVQRKQKNHPY